METRGRTKKGRVLGILGILLSIWILWGAEGLGAESPEPETPQPEEGEPDTQEPEDTLPPRAEITWRDEGGELVTEFYLSGRSVTGELVIREENLDLEHTRFMLEALDAGGEKVSCREAEIINGKNWEELWELSRDEGAEAFPFELEQSGDCYRMRLHLETEANYVFSGEIVDQAGNRASMGPEEVEEAEGLLLGAFCLDRTPPQIRGGTGPEGQPAGDITWSAGQQTFFRKRIHGLTFGYFCSPVMTVQIGAWDPVSGIASITYEWEGMYGDEEEKLVAVTETADWEQGLCEAPEGGKAYAVLEIPESFRGVVRATARDRAGNEMGAFAETVGLLAESGAMHEKNSGLFVEILEGQGKKEGFYRGDVKLRFSMEDTFSGIRTVQIQAGSREEWLRFEEGEEPATGEQYEMILRGEENNGNQIPVRAVLTDFAGHTRELPWVPEIHIDTAAPRVSVQWSNRDVRNEKYYNGDRTAEIAVEERNFDPEDARIFLTGMEIPALVWSHEPGKTCGGSREPSDPGHGDDCVWRTQVVFDQDGEYRFGFSCVDAAGNEGSWGRIEEFVIDKTPPVLQAEWSPNQGREGRYFSGERTAVLRVTDQNFRPEDARVEIRELEENGEKSVFSGTEFRPWGEGWQAEAVFGRDGIFRLQAECTDLAGNAATPYLSEEFVIDRTPPEITFFGVGDGSANGETAAPGFRIRDVNLDGSSCTQDCTGTRGEAQGFPYTRLEEREGILVRWEDFARIPENDDLYRITVRAADLAGNETAAELSFSVNRFGSVYVMEEETERLAGPQGTRYTSQSPRLVVEEYNVDFLEAKRVLCSRDGEAVYLKEGRDYQVELSGDAGSWKRYRYEISSKNFEKEGVYRVILYSEDQAANNSGSAVKDPGMEFVVDKTGPDIVIANVEEQGRYESKSRRVRIDMQDLSGLKRAELDRNGTCAAVWEEKELLESQGRLTYSIPEEKGWQTLQIRAWDGAGNVSVTDKLHILVTDKRVFGFWEKPGLCAGLLVCLLFCLGAGGVLFAKAKARESQTCG